MKYFHTTLQSLTTNELFMFKTLRMSYYKSVKVE